jgi:hypothetical protein
MLGSTQLQSMLMLQDFFKKYRVVFQGKVIVKVGYLIACIATSLLKAIFNLSLKTLDWGAEQGILHIRV